MPGLDSWSDMIAKDRARTPALDWQHARAATSANQHFEQLTEPFVVCNSAAARCARLHYVAHDDDHLQGKDCVRLSHDYRILSMPVIFMMMTSPA